MVAMDSPNVSIRNAMAYWLADKLRKKSQAEIAAKVKARQASNWFVAIMRLVLQLSAFGCLTNAAFLWSSIAGWTIAGMSLFVISWLLTQSSGPNQTDQPRR